MKGIPIVVTNNVLGFPVKPVDRGAPLMSVVTNGLGAPVTISANGAPFVIDGLEPDTIDLVTNGGNSLVTDLDEILTTHT